MGMFKKEANRSGLFLLIKLSAGVLLSSALVACGGGSSSGGGGNGAGSGQSLPDPSSYALSCQGVVDGNHDGICFKVEKFATAVEQDVAFFNRNYMGKTNGDSAVFARFEGWDGLVTGVATIETPTAGQSDFSCEDWLITLPAEVDQQSRTLLGGADCAATFTKDNEQYSGTFAGEFCALPCSNDRRYVISAGHFRFTLWGQGDFINGNIDGAAYNQNNDLNVFYHLPGKKFILDGSTTADGSEPRWQLFIRNLDLLDNGPVTNQACSYSYTTGAYVSYYLKHESSQLSRYDMKSCQISFKKQGERLIGSFEGFLYDANQGSQGAGVPYDKTFEITLPSTPARYGYLIP